ncbi:MAG: hypothetical protein ACI89G_002542, partial [Minisyncoccia bacterium]
MPPYEWVAKQVAAVATLNERLIEWMSMRSQESW